MATELNWFLCLSTLKGGHPKRCMANISRLYPALPGTNHGNSWRTSGCGSCGQSAPAAPSCQDTFRHHGGPGKPFGRSWNSIEGLRCHFSFPDTIMKWFEFTVFFLCPDNAHHIEIRRAGVICGRGSHKDLGGAAESSKRDTRPHARPLISGEDRPATAVQPGTSQRYSSANQDP